MSKVVLTGGPGAGKTVVAAELVRRHPGRLVLVPEAATQVYERLGTRWDRLDDEGRRGVQREIYRLQLEQEARYAAAQPGKVLLLDRGTVDGAAYWPGGAEAYWCALGTTHEEELARYDGVVWLECAAAVGCYDGAGSNECRTEDAAAAIELGKRVAALWGAHPNLRVVEACVRWEEKVERVEREVLRWVTAGAANRPPLR